MTHIRLSAGRNLNWIQVARPAVLAGAVLLSAILALLLVNGLEPMILLGAVLGLIGAGIIYRLGRFEYGLLAVLLAAGLLNFVTLPTGRESRVVISLLLSLALLVTWAFQLFYTRVNNERLRPSPINKPLLTFVAVNILAYIWSQLMRDPLVRLWPSFPVVQLAALTVNIGLPLMLLLTSNKIKEEKWLRAMLVILVVLGFLDVLSRIFRLPTIRLIDNGSLGAFPAWVGISAYALALFNRQLKPWQRAACWLLMALCIFHYFFQVRDWVSGWAPMFLGIVVVTFFFSRRWFVVLCLVGAVVIVWQVGELYRTIVLASVNKGDFERIDIWTIALRHLFNHPLFGMGPAGYAVYYMTYNPTTARSTHNNYFDVVAQNGFIGFIAFLIMMGTLVWMAWRTRKAVEGRYDAMEAYACAALGGGVAILLSMALGDWILPFAYNQTITGFDNAVFTWMMLGGMVALYRMTVSKPLGASLPAAAGQIAQTGDSAKQLVRQATDKVINR